MAAAAAASWRFETRLQELESAQRLAQDLRLAEKVLHHFCSERVTSIPQSGRRTMRVIVLLFPTSNLSVQASMCDLHQRQALQRLAECRLQQGTSADAGCAATGWLRPYCESIMSS